MCGLAEKRASRALPESNTEEEEVMSKENAAAQGSQLSAAFPLTVAAKGTRNPRPYGYVARMRQQAAERRQSLAVARKPTVTGQQVIEPRQRRQNFSRFNPPKSFEQARASRQRRLNQPSLTRRDTNQRVPVG